MTSFKKVQAMSWFVNKLITRLELDLRSRLQSLMNKKIDGQMLPKISQTIKSTSVLSNMYNTFNNYFASDMNNVPTWS